MEGTTIIAANFVTLMEPMAITFLRLITRLMDHGHRDLTIYHLIFPEALHPTSNNLIYHEAQECHEGLALRYTKKI
jgi:hypothetical protein